MKYKLKLALLFSVALVPIGMWFTFITLVSATTDDSPHMVSSFDPTTLYVRDTIAVPYANELDLAPYKNLLYVTQWNSNGTITGLTILNTINYNTTSISLGSGFPLDVRILPDETRAYIGISKRNGYVSTSGSNRVLVVL